jgi:hypothetical protein
LINIYTNPVASLLDAKMSFIGNVAHGLVEGSWGIILEAMRDIIFINGGPLDLSDENTTDAIIGAWARKLRQDQNNPNKADPIATNGLVQLVSIDAYEALFKSCYNALIKDIVDDKQAHAVCANIWHPYGSLTDLNEIKTASNPGDVTIQGNNPSFTASQGSIIYKLYELLQESINSEPEPEPEPEPSWQTPTNLDEYISNAQTGDILVNADVSSSEPEPEPEPQNLDYQTIGGTEAIWQYIIDTYYPTTPLVPTEAEAEAEADPEPEPEPEPES